MSNKVQKSSDELVDLVIKNYSAFFPRFLELYPSFVNNIQEKHSDLSNSDLELCAFIFLNFSSKEIAKFSFIQYRSAQTKKSRLRKKLGISPTADLYKYIRGFSE